MFVLMLVMPYLQQTFNILSKSETLQCFNINFQIINSYEAIVIMKRTLSEVLFL